MTEADHTTAYISVGSNIDPEANLAAGLQALAEELSVVSISTMYASRPISRPEQADFVNGVWKLELDTELDPWTLKFEVLREVESRLGRTRGPDKHAARTLDLDLLLHGDLVIRSDDLVLPDPGIYKAAYVLFPLAEIAPNLVLPDTKLRVQDLEGANDAGGLHPLPELTASLKGWLHR